MHQISAFILPYTFKTNETITILIVFAILIAMYVFVIKVTQKLSLNERYSASPEELKQLLEEHRD